MAKSYMVYGPTGSGKTSHIISMAKWIYETTGKITRVITCDLGGVDVLHREGLVKAGIVKVLNVAGDNPLTLNIWRKLSRGWWWLGAKELEEQKDSDGVIIGPPVEKIIHRYRPHAPSLAKVGLTVIENATTLSEQLMRHLVKQEVIAEDGKVSAIGPQGASGRYEEDGEVVGGNSQGHYNIVQVEMYGLFSAFSSLPDDMLVGWTAHEGAGVIKSSGESCLVPLLVGIKKNHLVPSWVGDCFHLQDRPEVKNMEGEIIQHKEVRAYFTNHTDLGTTIEGSGLHWKAKSRVPLSDLAFLEQRFPGGYVPLGIKPDQGLDQYFRFLDTRGDKNYDALKAWKDKIDGARKG